METDLETVAAATGSLPNAITYDLLRGMANALDGTVSPLKDAVDRLIERQENQRKYSAILTEMQDLMVDEGEQFWKRSSLEPLDLHRERWRELIDEMQEILFRMM